MTKPLRCTAHANQQYLPHLAREIFLEGGEDNVFFLSTVDDVHVANRRPRDRQVTHGRRVGYCGLGHQRQLFQLWDGLAECLYLYLNGER